MRIKQFKNIKSIKNIFRLINLLFEENLFFAILLFFLVIIVGIIPAIEVTLVGVIVNLVSEVEIVNPAFFYEKISPIFMLLVGLTLLRNALRLISDGILDFLRENIGGKLQKQIMKRSSTVDLSFYDNDESFDQLQRANEGFNQRFINVYMDSILLFETSITIIAYSAALSISHWLLFPLALVSTLLSLKIKINRSNQKYAFNYNVLTSLKKYTNYFSEILTSKQFAKEIRVFHSGNYLLNKWKSKQKKLIEQVKLDGKKDIQSSLIVGIIQNGLLFGASLYFAYSAINENLSIGSYVILIQVFIRLQQESEGFVSLLSVVFKEGLFATDLFGFLENFQVGKGPDETNAKKIIIKNIHFENVWFKYPNADKWVLMNLNFDIKASETVALIGENGAGKSTIVKLILGFYLPQKGTIYLNDRPIQEIDRKSIWQNVSAVFQDFTKFELTVKESIGIGNIENSQQLDEIKRVANKVGADSFIDNLELEYETYLSKAFGGTELSGGQWQKIALARSLLKNANLLILDEPTSALDPLSEVKVFKQFHDLSKEYVTLLISHRMGTARLADRIIVIENGCKVEEGTHLELMRNKKQYYALFKTQAKWYTA